MTDIPDPIELMQGRMDRLEMAYVDEHTCICCPDCAWNQSTWEHLQATLRAPDGSIKLP